jgi:hypothetical protein
MGMLEIETVRELEVRALLGEMESEIKCSCG